MRQLCYGWFFGLIITTAHADTYQQLYQLVGWPAHISHFHDALDLFQQKYRSILPPIAYQAVSNQIDQRFDSTIMQSNTQAALRNSLKNPDKVFAFFNSDLGKKIIKAEVTATSKDYLQKNNQGLPLIQQSIQRQQLLGRLTQAVPYNQAAVETTVALTGSAKDVLEKLFPGMGVGNLLTKVVPSTETIHKQVDNNLTNTLANVYQGLSDQELLTFVQFAESEAGQDYYQATFQALLAGLTQ